MANFYLRSTDGSDADDGSTWALAKATIAGATGAEAVASAGDTVYISQAHSESTAATVSLTGNGTLASPIKWICGNDAAAPPSAVAATAVVATTGASAINLGGVSYFYGINFTAGSANNTANLTFGFADNSHITAENCIFELGSTHTASRIVLGNSTAGTESSLFARNCTWKFGNASQGMGLPKESRIHMSGGALAGSAITTMFAGSNTQGGYLMVEAMDLSAGAQGMNLIAASASAAGVFVFRNCKLPAAWSGALLAGAPVNLATRAEMYNCAAGDTNYALWVEDYAGSIKHETTIVRTGGASDGTTSLSWNMTSSANAEYPTIRLESPEIAAWNDTTGSAVTATVEVVTDNVTLTDAECWLEVQYLGTSGVPLGSFITDAKADVLASAANQATSTETWTTTGLTTPVKQKLSVTFTPQEKGFIHARVVLAKASTTVYVCPKLTVA